MRLSVIRTLAALLISVTPHLAMATDHFVSPVGGNVSPFLSWTEAATNIQDAIDAAAAGDVIWVTNGVYAGGGKAVAGDLTNRVALDKALAVRSKSGPGFTIIRGAGVTNGPLAVRCAWMTNGAILDGFTLEGGATRGLSDPSPDQQKGGGIWGYSTNASATNCLLRNNTSAYYGGGAWQVTLLNCSLRGNRVVGIGVPGAAAGTSGEGGGANACLLINCTLSGNSANNNAGGVAHSTLRNCQLTQNSSVLYAAAAYYSTLVNCTVIGNSGGGYGSYGGAVAFATLTNCIVVSNSIVAPGATNYLSSSFDHCCTSPLPLGAGNIAVDPQLLPDGMHLLSSSPCRGAGATNVVFGTDVDGQPWNNPPSMGCDEWQPSPVLAGQPSYQINVPAHGLTLNVSAAGQSPFSYFWTKDGVAVSDDARHSYSGTANPVVNSFGPEDAGLYTVVVSNAFGMVTGQVANVVIHAVDVGSTNPVAPYFVWSTAATNIQDAIDASAPGDIVLVADGVYAFGGKVMAGDLTNRIALDKPITAISANGYSTTTIQGAWDPISTNGPSAVRCAWLTDGAALIGFTLQNGATRAAGDPNSLQSGGAVWCSSTNGVVSNCLLANNAAINGSGISFGTLNNSLVLYNLASYGSGAYYATLNNCTVRYNYTTTSFPNRGAGTYDGITRNSIVVDNYDNYPYLMTVDNYSSALGPKFAQYFYSCTYPQNPTSMPTGVGNLNATGLNLQFLDRFHIAYGSPCRSAASALYSIGTDIDGELWQNPPSMGCDEVILSNLVGALSVSVQPAYTNLLVNRFDSFSGSINGRASTLSWAFGDGATLTNCSALASHQWAAPGDYTVTFTAYNLDNPAGVSANTVIHVMPPSAPQLQLPILLTNGYSLQFAGQFGANYTIQYTTNLASPFWQTLQTIYYSLGGQQQIIDPSTTNAYRFYRVLAF